MNKEYCGGCGTEMVEIMHGADEFYFLTEAGKIFPYEGYSNKTGKRQLVKRYECPLFKRDWKTIFFGTIHERYWKDKIIEEKI